jgi:RNA polymerase sigma-70 factor (ECF subfamily)
MLKLQTREPVDEQTLVERAIGRDPEAFGELYDLHVVRVYRHIYYLVGSVSEAEDLTAQTFLQAWQAIDRYQMRGAPFLSWLFRIAHNLAVSHLRGRRDNTQLYDTVVDETPRQNPEEACEQKVDLDRVRQAILKLGRDQRQVIILRFVEDSDYREVAEIMGKSVAAVRVIQHRALSALRKQLQVEGVSAGG